MFSQNDSSPHLLAAAVHFLPSQMMGLELSGFLEGCRFIVGLSGAVCRLSIQQFSEWL